MLVHIKEIAALAAEKKCAVGAFNIHNFESIIGVARAAVEANSPAIIQVSEGAIKYMGIKPITHLVATVAKNIAAPVPIALHLDHGRSFESVFECIRAGFTSVHIDASNLPLDENINLTQQVVELAHRKNVWVQGEVGAMVGGHGDLHGTLKEIPIASLDDVVNFVRRTGVDTIAAAIGTAHGVYDNEDIRVDLVKSIKSATKIPFVLHGGSGVAEDKIRAAIKAGVNIINIGSDIKIAFCQTLIKQCLGHQEETDPRNLLQPTMAAVATVVLDKMKLFGSAGQIKVQRIET
ncbi:tagatose-bisphosphate aldolase [Candidatus Falkowbacteria bacterium CG_4_10_14_0_2_um_filter_48_10]|uniref:Tagatose-bisphosphate aldolase n=1 Tax=Candidatus Falkowbacteria bacterium CG23_combo_of_CG06-09_8_20_14_all_49_15 TaxID=1974572 RepID=A0A2G9ZL88_9BACT|nr:MAG: tagatose-bisphosphate aldolase [Candidatus Falkowbacteria bacterium CG23_combo_of_CG06-09_8_20_14_all_49_15]PJA07725.1 MAG: tagatose-bisphosphate aldolase [Candidatus Falkowbacteria bacterium CG_4_10_14_0_2_um_filter_48_10]